VWKSYIICNIWKCFTFVLFVASSVSPSKDWDFGEEATNVNVRTGFISRMFPLRSSTSMELSWKRNSRKKPHWYVLLLSLLNFLLFQNIYYYKGDHSFAYVHTEFHLISWTTHCVIPTSFMCDRVLALAFSWRNCLHYPTTTRDKLKQNQLSFSPIYIVRMLTVVNFPCHEFILIFEESTWAKL